MIDIQSPIPDAEQVTRKQRPSGWGGARPGAGRKPALKDARRVTFDLESSDFERLRKIAERDGVSVSQAVRRAVRADLQRRARRR
jgi:hypothetical protein